MLEYQARNDPDIVIRSKRQRVWKGFPEQIEAESLAAEDVERALAEETSADCFFYFIGEYFVSRGASGPYFSVFLPATERRGYREVWSAGSGHGFCKR
ncbi:MAG: hypothetical protein ACREQQ_09645 [Candidatus Binatia bacterium]